MPYLTGILSLKIVVISTSSRNKFILILVVGLSWIRCEMKNKFILHLMFVVFGIELMTLQHIL